MALRYLGSKSGNKQELSNGQMECVFSLLTTACRCDRRCSPLLCTTSSLVYVVYNMEDEVDVDIEGDEFQSNVRSEYFLNIRI